MREASHIFSTKNIDIFEILTFEVLTNRSLMTSLVLNNWAQLYLHVYGVFWCTGTPPCFLPCFTKKDNFCDFGLARLDHKTLKNRSLSLRHTKIAAMGANPFL